MSWIKNHRELEGYEIPYFHWILRDFILQLNDKLGKELTSNEYLEHCWAPLPVNTLTRTTANEINRKIRLEPLYRPSSNAEGAALW